MENKAKCPSCDGYGSLKSTRPYGVIYNIGEIKINGTNYFFCSLCNGSGNIKINKK